MSDELKNNLKPPKQNAAIRVFVMLVLLVVLAVVVQGSNEGILLWLPGTQPGQTTEAERVERCKLCHPRQVSEWSGSMMAHATRDPIFNALLAITTKHTIPRGFDTPEYCLRCHSPLRGWRDARTNFPCRHSSALTSMACIATFAIARWTRRIPMKKQSSEEQSPATATGCTLCSEPINLCVERVEECRNIVKSRKLMRFIVPVNIAACAMRSAILTSLTTQGVPGRTPRYQWSAHTANGS